mgnify:CR=1 FL=1
MQIPLRKRLLLYIIIITFVGLIISAFIVLPAMYKITLLKSDIYTIQNELEKRYDKTQKLKRSIQELDAIKLATEKLESITLKPGNELRIITELENIAQQNNIEQNPDLEFVDATNNKNYNATDYALPQFYKFSFLNNGYFEDHITYLKSLEELPYYIIIDNLSWEKRRGTKEDEKGKITLRFEGIIYVDAT